ncbi:hypothetical protein, partial [Nostoc flagelliforme]|uniref:hypothetical protein n=1 Tax=Nostoc flagelliforme TaxID=1306274 RepID=UPI001A7F0E38
SKLSVTISKLYDYVFTKISKLALKALNSLALEFSDKSNSATCQKFSRQKVAEIIFNLSSV